MGIVDKFMKRLARPSVIYYHCTDEDRAKAILKEGFKGNLDMFEYFLEYFSYIFGALPLESQKRLRNKIDKDITERSANLLMDEWFNIYGEGTVIWVSDDLNDDYGDACFEVHMPSGAKEIIDNGDHGYAFYYPQSSIPAKNFKLLSSEVIDKTS